MDPVNRALWWREHDPELVARTRWFMNWHEYFSLLLTGRPVIDASDAGTWAIFDVASGSWSPDRIVETGSTRLAAIDRAERGPDRSHHEERRST